MDSDADLAIAVVAAGAEVVAARYGTALERLDKGAGDFSTNADVEAEAAMLAVLRRARPSDAVLGEESGRTGAASDERTWLIDPLCGTHNYAARTPVVAVNAALASSGAYLAAAVADPFALELFWTDGRAAFVRAADGDTPLVPSAISGLVDLNLDPPFSNAPTFRAATLAADDRFNSRFRPRVVSTSLALAWVATGQRAAYVTDGDVRASVHFAAGLALCESTGCVVTDLRADDWRATGNGLLAAADAETHAELSALIHAQFERARD